MPNARKSYRLNVKGLNLNSPVDAVPDGYLPLMKNVAVLQDGSVTSRSGSQALFALPDVGINSIRRMNYAVNNTYTRFVGAAQALFAGPGTPVQVDAGYSGNPLSLITFRPNSSPEPWMYVADKSRMSKVRITGQRYNIGIPPPNVPPVASLFQPNLQIISNIDGDAWTGYGTGSATTTSQRFNSTIGLIIYDNPAGTAPSWCTIYPGTTGSSPVSGLNNNYQPGALIILNSGQTNVETTAIREVYHAIPNTAISGILYDNALINTGPCSITISAPSPALVPYCLLKINSEIVRVTDVIIGLDKIPSFRCVTVSTHAPGETITGYDGFRCYTVQQHAAAETLTGNIIGLTVAVGDGGLTLSKTINLSQIGIRAVQQDDYAHLSVLMDQPQNLIEGKIIIDVGDGSFTENYFYYTFTSSDIQANVSGILSAITTTQSAIQRQIVESTVNYDNPVFQYNPNTGQYGPNNDYNNNDSYLYQNIPVSAQAVSGVSQWSELQFKIAEFTRVGSDLSKTLANAVAFRVDLTVSASVQLAIGSFTISGTYGPDVQETGAPYVYSYRYRSSVTGAVSNRSPESITGLNAYDDRITISFTPSTDPQVDTIDLFRFGGNNNEWLEVGSYPNSTATINDDLPDDAIITNNQLPYDDYQPFPITDLPRIGQCNVAGISINWLSGDQFNLQWAKGSFITIGSNTYTLYRVLSPTQLQIVESASPGTNVQFNLAAATIYAQPFPYIWFYSGSGTGTYMLGVGDPYNPGFLHWSKGNNPDTSSDKNTLEVTSPSEPLIAGGVYDGNCYVFSSERVFQVLPTTDAQGNFSFISQEFPVGKGLFGQWALAISDSIYFVNRSGIWALGGSGLTEISRDISPLFPKQAISGIAVNGYNPVSFSDPAVLRLYKIKNNLYFCYVDSTGANCIMRYDLQLQGWFPESYVNTSNCFYEEEGYGVDSTLIGDATGQVRQINNSLMDGAQPFTSQIRTPSLNYGDSRRLKFFTDLYLDANPANTGITALIYWDSWTSTFTPSPSVIGGAARQISLLQIAQISQTLHRDFALDLQWGGAACQIYEIQPGAQVQPYAASALFSQFVDHGSTGYTHIREGYISLISNQIVNFNIQTELGNYIIYLPSTGGVYQKLYFPTPVIKGKAFQYSATSSATFILFPDESYVNIKQWGGTGPFQPFFPFKSILEDQLI